MAFAHAQIDRAWRLAVWLLLGHGLLPIGAPLGAEPVPDVGHFSREVAPIFERRCLRCHDQAQARGGLSLARGADVRIGGDSGPAVVPGHPDQSRLLKLISGPKPKMPKKGQALTQKEKEAVRQWIAAGAAWPEDIVLKARSAADETWWSLQPVARPPVPAIRSPWIRNPIDAFALARLQQEGLQPSPEASRRALVRRLHFDLIGLPPTPTQVDTFLQDLRPGAYERLVDRLLASPQFGERWARHWLDIAHYADTHGYERDRRRDHAWPYRDYVIAAFNADKPYDQFLREQIAGDVISPGDPHAVIATGFVAAGPWDFTNAVEAQSQVFRDQARSLDLDDMVTTVVTATMGLTINCARCHDHKFDPLSQAEYYGLCAVFTGVKRGDRNTSDQAVQEHEQKLATWRKRLGELEAKIGQRRQQPVSLADIVAGASGFGGGEAGRGIDARSGVIQKRKDGFLGNVKLNVAHPVKWSDLIDSVGIPDGGEGGGEVMISTTGLKVTAITDTDGRTWDHIQTSPVRSQKYSTIDGINYASDSRTMLGLHANKWITFNLQAIRKACGYDALRLQAVGGYGGMEQGAGADIRVFVDGKLVFERLALRRKDGGIDIDIPLAPSARFLTLMATDGGNGISHDQIFFGDPRLVPTDDPTDLSDDDRVALERWETERRTLKAQVRLAGPTPKVYALVPQKIVPIHILDRGDIRHPGPLAPPSTLSAVAGPPSTLGDPKMDEGQRRRALAQWITHPAHPLTSRVIANRLWHHHFGAGIVATPSDFGFLGDPPSHPQLLDWLSNELQRGGWSLKHLHRIMVTSSTYRQSSGHNSSAAAVDADNRLLWRKSPSRLEAEVVRDAVLAVSGTLNRAMGGPGYRDFRYTEKYAPIYKYVVADRPELWRRTIYRFVVRSTPDPFMQVLDCPDPSVLTAARSRTTTALQSLSLLNNPFMIDQSLQFARRVESEAGSNAEAQAERAYHLAFGRPSTAAERHASVALINGHGLRHLCRALLNANEFVHVD